MLGFAPAILQHLKVLMAQNYGGVKITPAGFTKLLVQNNPNLRVSSIDGEKLTGMKLSTSGGHIRGVRVKSLPRITPDQVKSEDNCDNDVGFQYIESDINAPLYSKLGFQLEWGFVERYQKEASDLKSTGKPNTPVLNELLEQLMHCVNGIIGDMDNKLLGSITFGNNVVTGNNLAKTININKQGNVLDLSEGLVEMLNDANQNEFVGDMLLTGSGLFNKFTIAKPNISANQAGIDLSGFAGYKWYNDLYASSKLGANEVAAFAKGAVGLVDIDRYLTWKAGKFGNSHFCQIMLPVESGIEGMAPVMMPFNLQIIEKDCPAEAFNGYNVRQMGRGWTVLISKAYGLWQAPTSQFQATDRLANTNGSLRYVITNDCNDCP